MNDASLNQAERLLRPDETCVPPTVLAVVAFFAEHELWFRLSRNEPAHSCRDAAKKRFRLGHVGIELWQELRTFFGKYTDSGGRACLVLVHTRGDREIDLGCLRIVLNTDRDVARLSNEEIERLGFGYGLVNPFVGDTLGGYPVTQIFDTELVESVGPLDTVMTNAGDRTWGIEFDVVRLIDTMSDARLLPLSKPDTKAPARTGWGLRPCSIGIITGNPPESGVLFTQMIIRAIRELLGPRCFGDISLPQMEITSVPALGLSMELDTRRPLVLKALEEVTRTLCERGVTVLTLPCHTTQFFAPQISAICTEYGVEFVSMPDVLAGWLSAQQISLIALVGIRTVADFGLGMSAYERPLERVRVERVSEDTLAMIVELAYKVKRVGAQQQLLSQLRDILRSGVTTHHVVLALTELSLLLQLQRDTRGYRVLIDPLRLYAEAIAHRFVGQVPAARR